MGENCCRNTTGQCNGAGEDMVCTKHIWYTFTGISVKFATLSNFQKQNWVAQTLIKFKCQLRFN
jgi:hypothetical protein